MRDDDEGGGEAADAVEEGQPPDRRARRRDVDGVVLDGGGRGGHDDRGAVDGRGDGGRCVLPDRLGGGARRRAAAPDDREDGEGDDDRRRLAEQPGQADGGEPVRGGHRDGTDDEQRVGGVEQHVGAGAPEAVDADVDEVGGAGDQRAERHPAQAGGGAAGVARAEQAEGERREQQHPDDARPEQRVGADGRAQHVPAPVARVGRQARRTGSATASRARR
ncbi:hypothetical protein GCM10025868_20200 [Angustibacter aerolatus]|uniref:Uncharacterized protein n=1 Tax=Angustibacter aerolatus TaxID=1162965 RepID=A0ABQ6JIW7_9ACTN|nr:hypothetical protein GCM10025868_20200 [Angustibacter aerolatus]